MTRKTSLSAKLQVPKIDTMCPTCTTAALGQWETLTAFTLLPQNLRYRPSVTQATLADVVAPTPTVMLRCSATSKRANFDRGTFALAALAVRRVIDRIADSRWASGTSEALPAAQVAAG